MFGEVLDDDVRAYMFHISEVRAEGKYGQAVQVCDKLLAMDIDPGLKMVVSNFKADSLFRVGWMAQQDALVDEAVNIYNKVLAQDAKNFIAKNGLNMIKKAKAVEAGEEVEEDLEDAYKSAIEEKPALENEYDDLDEEASLDDITFDEDDLSVESVPAAAPAPVDDTLDDLDLVEEAPAPVVEEPAAEQVETPAPVEEPVVEPAPESASEETLDALDLVEEMPAPEPVADVSNDLDIPLESSVQASDALVEPSASMDDSLKCAECGSLLEEGATECFLCGAPVPGAVSTEAVQEDTYSEEPLAEEGQSEEELVYDGPDLYAGTMQDMNNGKEEKSKKKKKKGLFGRK